MRRQYMNRPMGSGLVDPRDPTERRPDCSYTKHRQPTWWERNGAPMLCWGAVIATILILGFGMR